MKFEKALKHHHEGKKIRRPTYCWTNKEYYYGKSPCPECYNDLDEKDAIAEDWEIME